MHPAINLVFVTGNTKKVEEVRKILGPPFNVINLAIDLPEIQATEVSQVIQAKTAATLTAVQEPTILNNLVERFEKSGSHGVKRLEDMTLICEDTGLFIDQISTAIRFPGALAKFYLQALRNKGIIERDGGSTASVECHIGIIQHGKIEPPIVGIVKGSITKAYKGEGKFGFDASFIPHLPKAYADQQGLTYDELEPAIKNKISHRSLAFNALITKLLGHQ